MAKSLSLSRITYTYPGAPLAALSDVSAAFEPGWTGIVGDNGCGKSTLARIACGAMTPDSGSVTPRLSFAYCAQDAGVAPDTLFDFACDFAPHASALRRTLHLEDDMPWRFAELSCGEQKKLQIACALWTEPELLVVDEPTNHVDAACRDEIRTALAAYPGIGLLISHDRELLDALASRCLCFESGRTVMRPGNYTQAREQARIDRETTARQRKAAKVEVAKLSAEHAKRAAQANRTASRLSARHLDKHDSDGRAKRRLAVYTGQDGKAGMLAARIDARTERAREKLDNIRVEKRYEGTLWLDAQPYPRKVLLRVDATSLPCGPDHVLDVPELLLGNADHWGLRGPNGAGKSTLVRHLMRLLEETDFPVLYIPQEIAAEDAAEFLAEVKSLPAPERGALLSVVAQLNSDPDRILAGERVSPGELRKLMLARGIMSHPALIVMDEPTNHLDVHSVEALERALAAYPGALVLVSHDDAFMDATCDLMLSLSLQPGKTTCHLAAQ